MKDWSTSPWNIISFVENSKDKCPYGCPCDDFECEPDKNSILVLNTQSSNKPVLINYDGGVQNDLEFAMGPETSVYFSCSAKLNGDFYVFGGFGSDNRQVSVKSKIPKV